MIKKGKLCLLCAPVHLASNIFYHVEYVVTKGYVRVSSIDIVMFLSRHHSRLSLGK